MIVNDERGCTPTERQRSRRYRMELLSAAAAYVVLLVISTSYVDRTAGAAKIAIALVPMLGVVAMALVVVRYVTRADELERQTLIVSAAIAAVVTAVVTMLLGFLENAGVPPVSLTFVWPLIAGVFGVSLPFVRRRYR